MATLVIGHATSGRVLELPTSPTDVESFVIASMQLKPRRDLFDLYALVGYILVRSQRPPRRDDYYTTGSLITLRLHDELAATGELATFMTLLSLPTSFAVVRYGASLAAPEFRDA